MSDDRLYGPPGSPAHPYPTPGQPATFHLRPATATLAGRTWPEAATAIPDRDWGRPVRARVYRTAGDPGDPEVGPCWHWRCPGCDQSGNGCLHQVIHTPGSWRAVMCAAFQHVHRRHPRPVPDGHSEHTTLAGRRRCDWGAPTVLQLHLARRIARGEPGLVSGGAEAREFAREVLALAGYER